MMRVIKRDMSEKIVVAVSGGVDSVVLLDMLAREGRDVVVAHVNHGIRTDSDEDERFVTELAKRYQYPFESTQLNLGENASEELARDERYRWLEEVRQRHGAASIATAHHQDDVIETMIINMLRGTGWRGLSSLRNSETRFRPLLATTKAEVHEYARVHDLYWRDDSTNEHLQYLRNRVRQYIGAYLSPAARKQFVALYDAQVRLRSEVDREVARLRLSLVTDDGLDRHHLIMSEDEVAIELLLAWLGVPLERQRVYSLLRFAKTAKPGGRWSLDGRQFVVAKQRTLIVSQPDD